MHAIVLGVKMWICLNQQLTTNKTDVSEGNSFETFGVFPSTFRKEKGVAYGATVQSHTYLRMWQGCSLDSLVVKSPTCNRS